MQLDHFSDALQATALYSSPQVHQLHDSHPAQFRCAYVGEDRDSVRDITTVTGRIGVIRLIPSWTNMSVPNRMYPSPARRSIAPWEGQNSQTSAGHDSHMNHDETM
nr:hypothetical protein CFP56_50903 [Quercus suber]